ncbi:bacterio-opsin activator HTH domain-containing protein [Natrinema pellirubrum DSM 15624]|uniref:Bacterio-opsin activator HTH domain-containing protein n=1 Tax=Natrinema pellirubrum (strain DSM 15624 / CIP 106293 / JCM 10476 / NCIMB 786 / 157) TaxID=797303 RepID=L0JN95_NATP1|nr:helix-turn-helix domain-containing protein [Natrinema pellirubrum]AGB32067.1 putative DNA binding protein [Natrinema pellirubrum DSM 15624]ELY78067.1 bacterio-opsin activator HTH domain-containing protein [Natrinema pellirubrum DSM 15624]
MVLIVEFEIGTPILRRTVDAVSRIDVEEIYQSETGSTKLVCWMYGDDLEGVEPALADDTTVAAVSLLEDPGDRRLYSVTLSERGQAHLTYPTAAEYDIGYQEITVTEETSIRARVPTREALFAYRDVCREKEIPFRIQRIFEESAAAGDRYGITERQRKALIVALEEGYFDVPRETTLSAVAAKLDISDQALSARLRRGQANLLRNTIGGPAPT